MRYEVWVWENSNKRVIMKNYKNYKSAKSVANLFAKQYDITRVEIYGTETVKDKTEEI